MDAVLGHGFDAGVDVFGGVADDLRLDRWREDGGFRGENLARFAHGFDDVGAALFHHGESDGGTHVDTAVGLGLFRGFFDRSDVADFDCAAVGAASEGQVFELFGGGDFPEQTDDTLPAGGVEASAHHIDIFCRDGVHHLGERQSREAQAVRIDFNPDLTALEAVDQDFGDAGDEFQFALNVVEDRTDFAQIEAGRIGHGEGDQRHGDVEFLDHRRFGRPGEFGAGFVDGLADVVEHGLDVIDGGVDLDENVREIVLRNGADLGEAFDVGQFLLDGHSNGALEVLRRGGGGVQRGDEDKVGRNVGEEVALQFAESRVVAGEDDHEGENIDRDTVFHTPCGQTHVGIVVGRRSGRNGGTFQWWGVSRIL